MAEPSVSALLAGEFGPVPEATMAPAPHASLGQDAFAAPIAGLPDVATRPVNSDAAPIQTLYRGEPLQIPDLPAAVAHRSDNVRRASQETQARLGHRAAVSQATGAGREIRSQEEIDMATLSERDLRDKYGNRGYEDMRSAWLRGQDQYRANLRNRDTPQIIGDSAVDVGNAFVGGLASLGSLAAGIVSPEAGAWGARQVDNLTEFAHGLQSTALQGRRQNSEVRSSLDQAQNDATYQREREEKGDLVAGLSQFGRGLIDGARNILSDPTMLTSEIASGVGSMLGAGKVSSGLRAIGRLALPELLEGAARTGAAARVAAIGDRAAMPAAIGLTEGGGAYQGAVSEVMGMSFEQLARTSPEFSNLVQGGMTPERARIEVANRAGYLAAGVQAPIAAAAGTLVGRFEEMPFRIPTRVGTAVGNLGREGIEEFAQSGSGAVAQNLGIQQFADESRELTRGAGEQAIRGAVAGIGTAGAVQAPGGTVRAAIDGTRALGRGALAIGEAVAGRAEASADQVRAQTEAASPMSTANMRANVERNEQAAQEAAQTAVAAVQASNATPEQKQAATEFIQNLASANRIDPATLDDTSIPQAARDVLGRSASRVEAFLNMATALLGAKNAQAEADYSQGLNYLLNSSNALLDADPDVMKDILPGDHPAILSLIEFSTTMQGLDANPQIQRALAKARAAESTGSPGSTGSTPSAPAPAPANTVADLAQAGQGQPLANTGEQVLDIANRGDGASLGQLPDVLGPLAKAGSGAKSREERKDASVSDLVARGTPGSAKLTQGRQPGTVEALAATGRNVGGPVQAERQDPVVSLANEGRGIAPAMGKQTLGTVEALARKGAERTRWDPTYGTDPEPRAGKTTKPKEEAKEESKKEAKPKAEPKKEKAPEKAAEKPTEKVDENEPPPTEEEIDALLRTAANDARELKPEQVKRVNVILRMASSGKINLTEAQKAILKNASASLDAARRYIAGKKAMGDLNVTDDVTDMVLTAEDPKRVNQRSANRHARDILTAVKEGDIRKAKNLLTDMGKFVRHMNNQLDVMNDIFATRPQGRGSAHFEALSLDGDPASDEGRAFIPSTKMTGISPKNTVSVTHAQRVHLEAERLAFVYNSLVEALPSLGGVKIEAVGLNEALLGNVEQVVKEFEQGLRKPGPKVDTRSRAVVPVVPPAPPVAPPTGGPVTPPVAPTTEGSILNEDGSITDVGDIKQVRSALKEAQNKVYSLIRRMNRLEELGDPIDDETQEDYAFWTQNLADLTGIRDGLMKPERDAQYAAEQQRIQDERIATQEKAERTNEGLARLERAIANARAEMERLSDILDSQIEEDVQIQNEYFAWDTEFNQLLDLYGRVTDQEVPRRFIAGPAPALNESLVPTPPPAARKKLTKEEKADERVAAMKAMFPNLLGSNVGSNIVNWFTRAFYIPEKPVSRLMVDSPFQLASALLSNQDTYNEVVGGNSQNRLDSGISRAYDQLLGLAVQVKMTVEKRMQENLYRVRASGKTKGLTKLQVMEMAGDAGGFQLNNEKDGRVLNIVEIGPDGKAIYNDQLIESAVLAGMQWLISNINRTSNYDAERIGKLLHIDEAEAAQYVDIFNSGIHTLSMHQDIADRVSSYWGLSKNGDVPIGHTNGIPLGVAAEVLEAFEAMGLITGTSHFIEEGRANSDETQYTEYKFWNVVPERVLREEYDENGNLVGKLSPIRGFPNAIEKVSLLKPVDESYYGDDVPEAPKSQVNTPFMPLTTKKDSPISQEGAVQNANNTTYLPDTHVIGFYAALEHDGVRDLFGEGDLTDKKRKINVNDKKSLEGRNLGLSSAFQSLFGRLAEMQHIAGSAWNKLAMHFPHGINRTGRLQNLDSFNAQSNKFIRAAILPTWGTLDLTKESHQRFWNIAVAQALGIKVHKNDYDTIKNQLTAKLEALEPVIEMLRGREWNGPLPKDFIPVAKSTFRSVGIPLSGFATNGPLAVQALLEHVRKESVSDRTSFRTSFYIEADGVTNGIANSLHMFTSGGFTEDWVENVAKGGFFVRQNGVNTMNDQFTSAQGDSIDLYGAGSKRLQDFLRTFIQSLPATGSPAMRSHAIELSKLMGVLLPGMEMSVDGKTITIGREILKNPMTITLYGAGLDGIAKKITKLMLDQLYAKKTLEAQAHDVGLDPRDVVFWDDVLAAAKRDKVTLTDGEILTEAQRRWDTYQSSLAGQTKLGVRWDAKRQAYGYFAIGKRDSQNNVIPSSVGALDMTSEGAEAFTLDRYRREALTSSVRQLFVGPLGVSIKSVIGENLIENTKLVQQATHIQGMVLQAKFQEGIQAAMAKNAETIPGWNREDFISQNQLTEILVSLEKYAPLIRTENQQFFIPGRDRSKPEGIQSFGSSLTGGFSTAATVFGPGEVGVSGLPILNIGMGDGMMIQIFMNEAGDYRVVPIYDGINLALDAADTLSRKANEAAYESWKGNPVKAVFNSFRIFLKAVEEEDFPLSMYQKISKTLDVSIPQTDDIKPHLEKLNNQLLTTAHSIEVMHKVIDGVSSRTDQMASVAAPFIKETGVKLEGTNKEVADALQRMYVTALRRSAQAYSGVSSFLVSKGSQVLNKLPLSDSQREVMDQILGSLGAKDYRIVYGTPTEIDNYQILNGMERHSLKTGADGQRTHGLISTGERVIYVVRDANNQNEAVVHELIHASTFEKLLNHYEGGSEPQHVRDAIHRLETLGDSFLALDPRRFSKDLGMTTAYNNAYSAITKAKSEGKWTPVALNEFMAWTMANQDLAALTKKAPSVVQMVKDALQAIWSLVIGDRNVVAPRVGNDMFSNILFNSSVLMNTQPTVAEGTSAGVLTMSSAFGNDERLASLRKTFDTMISRHINETSPSEKWERSRKLKGAIVGSQAAAISAEAHGFPKMTMQERTIFERIVTALSVGVIIDPPAISAMEELYRHITQEMKPEHFMKDPINREDNDVFQANQKYNTLIGTYHRSFDAQGRSSLLNVFFALAATNDSVREMLTKIPLPKNAKSKAEGWDGKLSTVFNGLMETVSNKISGIDTRAQTHVGEAIDALIHTIQETTQQEQSFIEQFSQPVGKGLDRGNDWVVKAASRASRTVEQLMKDLGEKTDSKLGKLLLKSAEIAAGVAREDRGEEVSRSITEFLNKKGGMHVSRDLWSDIVGRTESNAGPDDMIKITRTEVQQDRQEYRETVPTVIDGKFTRPLKPEEKSAFFRAAGKTDLASLLKGFLGLTMGDLLSLVQDEKRVSATRKALEAELTKLDPQQAQRMMEKSKQLATYMNTRVEGVMLLRNPAAIAHLLDAPPMKNRKTPTQEMERVIDQLTTLYALEGLSRNDRDVLSMLAKDESEGVSFTLSYLVGQRNEENNKASTGYARFNALKGYIPSEQADGSNLIVADDKEFTRLSEMSYVRVGDYEGSKAEWGARKKGYYFAPVNGRAVFNQGSIQNVRHTAGGVDANTGFLHDGMSAGVIRDKNTVERITKGMIRAKGTKENLLPVFDGMGQIVAYERSLDANMVAGKLEQSQDLSKMIGVWRGRQVEEYKAQRFNEMLVARLHEMYVNETRYNPERKLEYVNLEDPKADIDPVTRDAYKLVNQDTKDAAARFFGDGKFLVRRDTTKDVFGYRSASIGDAWTGNSRWSPEVQKVVKDMSIAMFGNKAYGWMVKTESQIQALVKDAKTLIVIKSIVVPVANGASNILQLIGRGVPIRTITTQLPRKLVEIHSYNKSRLLKVILEAELRAVEDNPIKANPLRAKIQSINDSHRRLSIWPLLERGEFSSISDANVNPDDTLLTGGSVSDYMDRKVNQLPKPVRDAGRYAIISKDTALFQGLQKAVAYSDFVAKAITYDDLMQRQGKTSEEALGQISEEFVNYDRLPGRARGYLEGMGLLWFWNFKLRFSKVALSMIRNNPLHALLGSVVPVPSFLGSAEMPINDAMPIKILDGSIVNSIGIDQGLSAPGMNPFWRAFR